MDTAPALDTDQCYRAVVGRDRRFDGVFYTAVRTTGIYCRPSCPAVTPKRRNVAFYVTPAAAQAAGFRACKRCRPDLTPGSPQWDVRADATGRAMRLIADGVVEREGVGGLAARTGYTPRHLGRILHQQVGAGPLAIARAQRAHTARILVETTDLPFADIAFAAGFASVRQFNATIRDVYAATPSQLRAQRGRGGATGAPASGVVTVRLPVRPPFDAAALWDFLAARAVAGVEQVEARAYRRTLRLPRGHGRVTLSPRADHVGCALELTDLRDLASAVERCRRLLDLDADPVAIDQHLAADPALATSVRERPGVRVPGHVDGFEVAVRAIVGQQVSVAGARSVLARLAREHGERVDGPAGVERLFPSPDAIAAVDPRHLPMPQARGAALVGLAASCARGDIVLDRGSDRADVREALLALPGVGPWTADYIALRALGDPDVFMPTDLGIRRAMAARGLPDDPVAAAARAERWRPWRSYAQLRLWTTSTKETS